MTIIEKMARALETRARKCGAFNYIKASYLTIDGKGPHPRAETFALADIHEAARAARDAMVDGLTDEQMYELSPLWNPYNATAFVLGDYCRTEHIKRTRAALVAATEVDDG